MKRKRVNKPIKFTKIIEMRKEMKNKRIKIIVSLLLLTVLLSGCFGVDRSFRQIRNYILENTSGEYDKDFEFSIGSTGISLASVVVSFADTEESIEEVLSEISSVQVGIYSNKDSARITTDFAGLKHLTNLMEKAGWEFIVRSVDRNELTAVFVRIYENQLNRVFVISVNHEEMALVEMYGNVEKVIEIAIREGELNLHSAVN